MAYLTWYKVFFLVIWRDSTSGNIFQKFGTFLFNFFLNKEKYELFLDFLFLISFLHCNRFNSSVNYCCDQCLIKFYYDIFSTFRGNIFGMVCYLHSVTLRPHSSRKVWKQLSYSQSNQLSKYPKAPPKWGI